MKIDAHQHFWNYNPQKHSWMNEEMELIKTDFLPVDLKPILYSCSLDGCVAVQANQDESENKFLLDLAHQNDFIKGIVGWVDFRSENVNNRLEYYKQFPKMKGFRHVIHDEPDLDFMLQPTFLRGIKKLQEFGYTYDILIFESHLVNTYEFVKHFPDQPFVVDHIAKPNIKMGEIDTWKKGITALADFENVHCKVSGMVTEADWKHWKKDEFKKYLDVVVQAFGTDRIMYGSDWPVCTLAATYGEQYNIVNDYFAEFSSSERDLIFGGNATKFYDL